MATQQFEIIASPTEIAYNFEENITQHTTSNATEPLTNSMVSIRLSDALSPAGENFSKENVEHSPDKEPFPEVLNDLETSLRDSRETPNAKMKEEGAMAEESREPTHKSTTSNSTPDHTSLGHRSISIANRRNTRDSSSSGESAHVDWEELDNEEQEQRDEGSDDSVAFLLARLEQENNALATNPKAGISHSRARGRSRPPSIQQLRKLITEPTKASFRYSMLPSPPPMTELEFWAALVSDYPHTAQRLPTLTSNKIRSGIPPPLRGVVWLSIAGARDRFREDEYIRLCGESSPYEKLIGKDVGRSFPGVDMFRDPNGEGQKMLGKVLNAFSLWDQEIGYCQGLGFVVGPLLMHMGDKEAFCVLVRLMEHYDLRSCFLPDLSGLHLRIYQFQSLLSRHLPTLTAHLEKLKLEPLYLSQWFLSFFGVTCPLPMLLRIYDIILTEGASETLMRVALSLMRRNEKRILAATEFEDVMQLLLSRSLWDTYGFDADDLVNDFCGLTGLVTREGLEALEATFKEAHMEDPTSPIADRPNIHSAASRFLGRFWTGSTTAIKPVAVTTALSAPTRPGSFLRRTPSKQSMASTLNSVESTDSTMSATSTNATNVSQHPSADFVPVKQILTSSGEVILTRITPANKDKGLHSQIEDLLTALSDMQRAQTQLTNELQREREEREEDRVLVQQVIRSIKELDAESSISANCIEPRHVPQEQASLEDDVDVMAVLEERFTKSLNKRSSIIQTKHQLREDVVHWKRQYNEEAVRSTELSKQLTEGGRDFSQVKEQLRDARSRIQDGHREKQRLEKNLQDLKSRKSTNPDTAPETPTSATSDHAASPRLREFRLGKLPQSVMQSTPVFSKRMSSLSAQAVLATPDLKPASEDALLLELVNAKTAEAVAKQELEEVKGKLDSLRRMISGNAASPGSGGQRQSPGSPGATSVKGVQEPPKLSNPTAPSGGFFSGWGKRTVSTPVASM